MIVGSETGRAVKRGVRTGVEARVGHQSQVAIEVEVSIGVPTLDVGRIPPDANAAPVARSGELRIDAAVTALDSPVARSIAERRILSVVVAVDQRMRIVHHVGLREAAFDVDVAEVELQVAAVDVDAIGNA